MQKFRIIIYYNNIKYLFKISYYFMYFFNYYVMDRKLIRYKKKENFKVDYFFISERIYENKVL